MPRKGRLVALFTPAVTGLRHRVCAAGTGQDAARTFHHDKTGALASELNILTLKRTARRFFRNERFGQMAHNGLCRAIHSCLPSCSSSPSSLATFSPHAHTLSHSGCAVGSRSSGAAAEQIWRFPNMRPNQSGVLDAAVGGLRLAGKSVTSPSVKDVPSMQVKLEQFRAARPAGTFLGAFPDFSVTSNWTLFMFSLIPLYIILNR